MFDVGFTELSLLAVLGLLVLGPERLPAVARVLGGYLRKARRTWNTVKAEIESELAAEDVRATIQQPLDELDELRRATGSVASAVKNSAAQALETEPEAEPETDPKAESDER